MVFCNYCACNVDVEVDDANGFSCCVQCGRVLEDIAFSADITFQKDAAGESTVVGQFVNESGVARGIGRIHGGRVYTYQADSHERAQQRGRGEIAQIADRLSIRPRDELGEAAHRLYRIALARGFTRGRRISQVAAACLYLVCRQEAKPFLLIDFSDAIQVNVFTLGAVFLQLARLLRLEEHPTLSRPVDPSLYIHRFADRLEFGAKMPEVAATSMRLVASMKRDWIQTGRRPSGVCGAALYIAAHVHGFERSKRQIVAVVHIGEETLSRRLTEFNTTAAGGLTRQELEGRMDAMDREEVEAAEDGPASERPPALLEYGCEHLALSEPHFAHGMCRACYLEFVRSSGGMGGQGANPPAFERARRAEEAPPLLALPPPEEDAEEEAGDAAIRDEMAEALAGEALAPFASLLAGRRATTSGRKAAPQPAASQPADAEPPGSSAAPARRSSRRGGAAATRSEQPQGPGTGPARPCGAEEAAGQPAPAPPPPQQQQKQQGGPAPSSADALAIVPRASGELAPSDAADGERDTLSDISDTELEQYLADEDEAACKGELWELLNKDWVERQEAKRAALEAAERAAAEQRAAMEAAAAAGVAYKRGRGRPLGSRSKPRPEANEPPAETAQEAVVRALHQQRLSSKINYSALAELFESEAAEAEPLAGGAGGGGGREAAQAEAEPEPPQRAAAKRHKAGGPLSPRVASGELKPALKTSRVGGLRDANFASQMFGAGGGGRTAHAVPASKAKPRVKPKSVHFKPGTAGG